MKQPVKSLLCALLAIWMLGSLWGCGAKTEDKPNNARTDPPAQTEAPGRPASPAQSDPAAQSAYRSLLDYARRLEENGDPDAAAAVYEIIARSGGGDLANAAREQLDLSRTLEELDEVSELFGKGGGGQ